MPAATKARSKTRWGDKDARRKDILDAARALLERRGYQALTMRDVAAGAGITPGALYTYFTGKEELFAVLYAERLERFHAEIAPLCTQASRLEDLLVAIADRYRDVYRVFGRELDVWAVVLEPTADSERMARPLATAALRTLATVQVALDRLTPPRGGPSDADRRLAVPVLWATLGGLCEQLGGARHSLHPYGWDELTRFAARTFARGLVADNEENRR